MSEKEPENESFISYITGVFKDVLANLKNVVGISNDAKPNEESEPTVELTEPSAEPTEPTRPDILPDKEALAPDRSDFDWIDRPVRRDAPAGSAVAAHDGGAGGRVARRRSRGAGAARRAALGGPP